MVMLAKRIFHDADQITKSDLNGSPASKHTIYTLCNNCDALIEAYVSVLEQRSKCYCCKGCYDDVRSKVNQARLIVWLWERYNGFKTQYKAGVITTLRALAVKHQMYSVRKRAVTFMGAEYAFANKQWADEFLLKHKGEVKDE